MEERTIPGWDAEICNESKEGIEVTPSTGPRCKDHQGRARVCALLPW